MKSSQADPAVCVEICGDGIRVTSTIACDDGNTNDGDGCSSSCTVETGWTCKYGSSNHADVCIKNDAITYTLKNLENESSFYNDYY